MSRISKSIIATIFLSLPLLGSCQRSHAVPPTTEGQQPVDATAVIKVTMQNMQFSPATLEIKQGDVVEWTNKDITPHTATSASFDSGAIASGKFWRQTFSETGTISYACTFHPTMKGTVTVK